MKKLPEFICLIIIFSGMAYADTVYLKNGKKIDAIEAKEEADQIKCKIDANTRIGIPKENVERIEKNNNALEDDKYKIQADFTDADIRKVLQVIKKASGKNFAIDGDVSGTVTLTMHQPVYWEELLDTVLQMNQLSREYFGEDTIRIFKQQP